MIVDDYLIKKRVYYFRCLEWKGGFERNSL